MTSARGCVFCGSSEPLTREHVLPNWLSTIGLPSEPVEQHAGPLNRIPKSMGVSRPFTTMVRNVCGTCNNGWMGSLEGVAKRVLTPLIVGAPGRIDEVDQAAIAMWAQKTAMISMLLSSAEQREQGYGLPRSEYELLYERRDLLQPLPFSRWWVGRYAGSLELGSVWVTPLSVGVDGLPEADLPHGYAVSIALGALLIHGIRFTEPHFEVDASPQYPLVPLWPAIASSDLTGHSVSTDKEFLRLARGKAFETMEPALVLHPWRPAVELEASTLSGVVVDLPALCGKHVVQYPASLVYEAHRGHFYWFMIQCECDIAYLIHTEHDGAHAKAADSPERISELYESLGGSEFEIQNGQAGFIVKRDESPRS